MILAKQSPATGYEPSIYASTPIFFWVVSLLLIISGVAIVLYYIFIERLDHYWLWLVGLFLIFLSYTMILSLYISRGYYMWGMEQDSATHIGYVNQILSAGHIPSKLFYPSLHIYTSQIYLLCDISIITLHKILPLVFGILYIPFIYLFAKSIFSEKTHIIFSILASSTLIIQSYTNFAPNGLSNLFFPFVLCIFLRVISANEVRWELLVVIMTFSYPIFHPIPTFIFMIILCTLFLPNYIFNKVNNIQPIFNKKNNFLRFKLSLLVLLFVWSITWVSSFYVWRETIININTLIIGEASTHSASLAGNINYAKSFGYNVVEEALKIIGGTSVYLLITIISFPIIWRNKDKSKLNNLFSLYGPLFFICLFIMLFSFLNLAFSPLRLIEYVTILCTPFVGYFLSCLITKLKVKRDRAITFSFTGLILVLLILWTNGILTLYPSPYTLEPSPHTTASQVDGINWLFQNKNLDLQITGISLLPFRFGDLLLTSEQLKLQKLPYWSIPDNLKVPFHFDYNNNSTLSKNYNLNLYMGIDEKDKLIYKDVYPKMATIRWTPEDFDKLNEDISLYKIYSSKKFEIFFINGLQKT